MLSRVVSSVLPGDLTLDYIYDFERQCFYCGKTCIEDKKHTDRKNVETVRTINTKICTSTLEVCKGREGNCAEKQLLGISDFVAAETRHYSACM